MSAKNITTSQNKPDPAVNARVYNLAIDGQITYNSGAPAAFSAIFTSASAPTMSTTPVNINLANQIHNNIGVVQNGTSNFTLPADTHNYLITLTVSDIALSDAIGVIALTNPGASSPTLASVRVGASASLAYGSTQLVFTRPGGSSFTFYGYTTVPPTRTMVLGTDFKTVLSITRL